MSRVLQWLQQPTSVAGISAVLGTGSALALHQISAAQAIPLLVAAIISIALPDNAGAKDEAESLARSLIATSVQTPEKK
jgi:hypothetical protein